MSAVVHAEGRRGGVWCGVAGVPSANRTNSWPDATCGPCHARGGHEPRVTDLGTVHASSGQGPGGATMTWCGAPSDVPGEATVGRWEYTSCTACLAAGVTSGSNLARDRLTAIRAARPIPSKDRPHKCPRCGSAAYVGAYDVDCSKAGCR